MKKIFYFMLTMVFAINSANASIIDASSSHLSANTFLQLEFIPHTNKFAGVYWLPDYVENNLGLGYSGRVNDNDAPSGETLKCSDYSLVSCKAPKIGAGNGSKPVPGSSLTCYTSCKCPTVSNCTSEYSFTSPPANATTVYCQVIDTNTCASSSTKHKITGCNDGYVLSGNSCVIRTCPSGFTAGLTKATCPNSSDNYTTDGKSGTQICGKCTPSCDTSLYTKTDAICKSEHAGFSNWKADTSKMCGGNSSACVCSPNAGACADYDKTTSTRGACTYGYEPTACNNGCENKYKCKGCNNTCKKGYSLNSCSGDTPIQKGTEINECGNTCYACEAAPAANTCEQSLINAGYAVVTNEEDYTVAYNASKEVVLMEDLSISEINNNIYTSASLSSRFPLCPNTKSRINSGETSVNIQSTNKGATITIYPYITDDSYGTTIHNSVTFMGGAYFDSLSIDAGSIVTLSKEDYMLTYDYGTDGTGIKMIISDGAIFTIYNDLGNVTDLTLKNNGCLFDQYGYKVCSPSQALINPVPEYSKEIRNPLVCNKISNGVSCSGTITHNCATDTTPALLKAPITCESRKTAVFHYAQRTAICPVKYDRNQYATCSGEYKKVQSAKYPGCYGCQKELTEAIKKTCADEKTHCYTRADSQYDTCERKALNDKENCWLRAQEAFDYCYRPESYNYAQCNQEQDDSIDACIEQYNTHDHDYCVTTLKYDKIDCDDDYDACIEMPFDSANSNDVVCMKCV